MGHIISVSNPSDDQFRETLLGEILQTCHQIRQDLAGMGQVCQRIDDGYSRIASQFDHLLVIVGPDHNPIDIAAQNLSRVLDGLLPSPLENPYWRALMRDPQVGTYRLQN